VDYHQIAMTPARNDFEFLSSRLVPDQPRRIAHYIIEWFRIGADFHPSTDTKRTHHLARDNLPRHRQTCTAEIFLRGDPYVLAEFLDQSVNPLARFGTLAQPILNPSIIQTQPFTFPGSNWVEEPDPLNVTTISFTSSVGNDDMIKRALFCATTSKTNRDH
jgi:hypothetical protein